jgi:hypothetical protein
MISTLFILLIVLLTDLPTIECQHKRRPRYYGNIYTITNRPNYLDQNQRYHPKSDAFINYQRSETKFEPNSYNFYRGPQDFIIDYWKNDWPYFK